MSEAFEVIECPDRESWRQTRRLGIGASDAAAVIGFSPWKGAVRLYNEKIGLEVEDAEETEAMEWGRRLEPAVAAKYEEETGRALLHLGDYTILRSTKYPWMQTTLDRWIMTEDDRGPGILQAKTAGFFKKQEWEGGEPPVYYQMQQTHEFIVAGVTWGSLAVLIGGQKFLWCDFALNTDFAEQLIEREREFFERVQRKEPPPFDGSEDSAALLKQLYPRHLEGKVVALPMEALQWDEELLRVKAEKKALEERERAIKNLFAEAIGDAEIGLLSSGDGYSYKEVRKEPYTVKEQAYRELRRRAAKGSR